MTPGTYANAECRVPKAAWRGCRGRCAQLAAIIALFLIAAAASAGTSTSEWKTSEVHWHLIEIAGAPAGWLRTIISHRNDEQRTHTQTEMHIRRGETIIDVLTQEAFVERADGTPVRMKRIESSGDGAIEHEWRFGADSVTHVTRQFGRETKRELPPPEGVWLTPRAAARFLDKRRDAGAKEITYRTISPDSGLAPITVTTTYLRNDEHEFDGRTLPVTVWRTEMETLPLAVVEHVSADGLALKQVIELGSSRMVMRRSTRENVERWIAERDSDDAPELLMSNLVTPNRPIDRAHETRRAEFRVRAADGARPTLPSAGAQRVSTDDDDPGALIVTLDVDEPVAAPMDESQRAPYLAASSMLDFEDDVVRQLATIETKQDMTPMEITKMLQRRVHRHIAIKTLETAFASASETARSRRGDCTEHAVLLAALLRANGIPARIATGLVYADHFAGRDHVFGWHMWTQAWIDGKWWDFDAVLPGRRFHAGYVLVSTSALNDDQRHAGLAGFIQLLGSIEIDVIDVTHR